MTTNIINLTGHEVNLVDPHGQLIRQWPKCDEPLRLIETQVGPSESVDGIPLHHIQFDTETALPPQVGDTYYIVPTVVQIYYPERSDFITAHELQRDERGMIIGCLSFRSISAGR